MKNLKLDPATKDFIFDDKNNFTMVDGDDELVQSIQEILQVNLGEWFVNPKRHGFDRFKVLGQKFDKDSVTNELYKAILQEKRIDRLDNLTFDYDRSARILSVSFSAIKSNGSPVRVTTSANFTPTPIVTTWSAHYLDGSKYLDGSTTLGG